MKTELCALISVWGLQQAWYDLTDKCTRQLWVTFPGRKCSYSLCVHFTTFWSMILVRTNHMTCCSVFIGIMSAQLYFIDTSNICIRSFLKNDFKNWQKVQWKFIFGCAAVFMVNVYSLSFSYSVFTSSINLFLFLLNWITSKRPNIWDQSELNETIKSRIITIKAHRLVLQSCWFLLNPQALNIFSSLMFFQ